MMTPARARSTAVPAATRTRVLLVAAATGAVVIELQTSRIPPADGQRTLWEPRRDLCVRDKVDRILFRIRPRGTRASVSLHPVIRAEVVGNRITRGRLFPAGLFLLSCFPGYRWGCDLELLGVGHGGWSFVMTNFS